MPSYRTIPSNEEPDVNALLAGNLGQVLTVLQQGLASQEHQDFLKILSQKTDN